MLQFKDNVFFCEVFGNTRAMTCSSTLQSKQARDIGPWLAGSVLSPSFEIRRHIGFFKMVVDHLCFLSLVFFLLSRLFIAALWSPAGKGLTSWLLFVMFNYFRHFPMWYPGSVWYLIVSNAAFLTLGVSLYQFF